MVHVLTGSDAVPDGGVRTVLPPLCQAPRPQHTNQLDEVSIQPITGQAAMKPAQPYSGPPARLPHTQSRDQVRPVQAS